ncbi:MAG: LysR family transcriptional regulator [Synergistaceae bacterium]|nr:LysR family transcriptional regulator [Synergistaceae bacterium]
MNLQQLQYFKTIAEVGHVTKAAESLHISQPAMSMAIANLETELGVSLFKRKGRLIQLNSYGEILLEHVSVAIQEIETAKNRIGTLALSQKQILRVSSTYSLSSSLLPSVIQSFAEENPDAVIQIKQGPNIDLLQDLVDGQTDFVFGRILPAPGSSKSLRCMPLYSEELVILINKSHSLAERDELDLRDLKDEDFIFFHKSTGFHLLVANLFQKAGYKPKVRYTVCDNFSCEVMVSANLGVALIAPIPDYDRERVCQIKIKSLKENQIDTFLIWNSQNEQSDVCEIFLKHVGKLYPDKKEAGIQRLAESES